MNVVNRMKLEIIETLCYLAVISQTNTTRSRKSKYAVFSQVTIFIIFNINNGGHDNDADCAVDNHDDRIGDVDEQFNYAATDGNNDDHDDDDNDDNNDDDEGRQ